MFNQRVQFYILPCLGLLLFNGTYSPKASSAEIVTYDFSGSLLDSDGVSPFTVGETYSGSISVNLSTPKSSEFAGAATFDSAILNFNIAFGSGLRLEGASGGTIRIQTDAMGDSVILSVLSQATQFSNSSQELDTFGMLFFGDQASNLFSNKLTDLPQNFEGFSSRIFSIGLVNGPVSSQYANNGTLDTFRLIAVPEPSSVTLISIFTLAVSLRRSWRRSSMSCV